MRKLSLILVSLICLFSFAVPGAFAEPKDVQFHWEYDNASYGDVSGFRLYKRTENESVYSSSPFLYVLKADACLDGPQNCCMVGTIDDAEHSYFVLRAYNATDESEPSNEVEYTPEIGTLDVPTGLQLRLTLGSCSDN